MEQHNYSKALALLDKFHAGKCTDEELELLNTWYDSIGEEGAPSLNPLLSEAYQQQFFANFNDQTRKTTRPKHRIFRWVAAAAIVTGVSIGVSLLFMNHNRIGLFAYETITNTTRQPILIKLPDSSSIWLNTASSVKYRKNFELQQRQVKLEGEAFFDIQGSENNPFIVKTRDVDIKVLGTQFNVEAYANEDLTRVTLDQGKVKVQSLKDSKLSALLKPGYAASFQHNGEDVNITEAINTQYNWRNMAFIANDISFKDAATRLCNANGYTIKWENTNNIDKHINGMFDKSDFKTVLNNLCYITRKQFRITNKEVIIY